MLRKFASALALVLALAPVAARAGTNTHDHTKIVGHSAYAEWEYTNGDVDTFVSVVATFNDSTDFPNGQDAFVAVNISQASISTGNVLLTGSAYVNDSSGFTLTVDKDLGTATLHVPTAIFQDDNSFTFFNVSLDLTWTATADAVDSKFHSNYKEPGFHQISDFKGTFRDAVATGTIVGKDQNFTPVPSTTAQVQYNKFGSVTLTTTTP